nr:hypothetical protein [Tanacetum cinerariifolium]
MNELVNDGIKLSKLEINTGFINGLPKKWLSFCQSLKNTNHVKDSEDFQDSLDDEEDTRSSQEYLNDIEEEYQARALLAKSKRFFKKGTQRFSISTYQSPFQSKPLTSSQHKPKLRPTKDFEAKYNKVNAKLALLSSSASASKAYMIKNKGLITEAYEWDKEEVSSDDNEMVEVKVLMALAKENIVVGKESAKNDEWVKITMRKKLEGVELISGLKTIKSSLKSKSTLKAEALKGLIINEPSSAPAKGNKSSLASKVHSTPAGKLKSVKIEDDPSLAIVIKELNSLKLQVIKNQSSYPRRSPSGTWTVDAQGI